MKADMVTGNLTYQWKHIPGKLKQIAASPGNLDFFTKFGLF